MSWQQWQTPGQPPAVPAVLNAVPPVLNSAPSVVPPMQYTPEQWAQAQHQNWSQWAQWQQQYQQWHQQYGAEYQKSLNALAQTGQTPALPAMPPPVMAAPPLPNEPTKPPLPTEDPPPPTPSYNTLPPQPNNYTTAPPPTPGPGLPFTQTPGYQTQSPSPFSNRGRGDRNDRSNQPWSQNQNITPNSARQSNNFSPQGNKRNFEYPPDHGGKRSIPNNKPEWPNQQAVSVKQPPTYQQPPRSNVSASKEVRKDNIEDLLEAERKFDKQFADWEAQFNKWKEQNVEHPDKEQYKEYEKKWETWRAQLLERREQMRKKRLALSAGSPGPTNTRQPPPAIVSNNNKNNLRQTEKLPLLNKPEPQTATLLPPFDKPPPPSTTDVALFNKPPPSSSDVTLFNKPPPSTPEGASFEKPPPNMNNEPLVFKQPPKQEFETFQGNPPLPIDEGGAGFLQTPSSGGIPGLDLVKDAPEKDDKNDEGDLSDADKALSEDKLKKETELEAISMGINSILGDAKLLNMLSMVSQNQMVKNTDNVVNSTSKIQDPTSFVGPLMGGFQEHSNHSHENQPNFEIKPPPHSRDFDNNFDDQTRSSFTYKEEENRRRFEVNDWGADYDYECDSQYEDYPRDGFAPNQGRMNPDQGRFGPGNNKFPPGQQDRFSGPPGRGRMPGPNLDRFNSGEQDNFGEQNMDRFGGPKNDNSGPNNNGRFGRPNARFGGPNNDNSFDGPNNENRFSGPNNQHRFGGPNNENRFGGPNNQDRFGGQNQERFGGPNQDRFGGGQIQERFGGPNQDRFGGGPNNEDRFGGGQNQERFGGPNQDRFGGGPNNENRFDDPNNEDRFGGQNQERFGGPQNKFGGPNKDKNLFGGPNQDKFGGPNQNQFGGPNQDKFGGPNQNQFGGPNQDKFGGPNQNQFGGPNQNRFGGPIQDRYGGPNQGRGDNFGPPAKIGRYNSTEERFGPGPAPGRFGGPNPGQFNMNKQPGPQPSFMQPMQFPEEYDEEVEEEEEFHAPDAPVFDQAGEEEILDAPEAPSVPPLDDILKPSVLIDYDHKSVKPEIDILLEPLRMFDYRHKPVNRIPFPQRPRWLAEAINHIHEFDPPVVRQYEPPNLRRYPPPDANWRHDRYNQPPDDHWGAPKSAPGRRNYNYDESDTDKNWVPPEHWRRESKFQDAKPRPVIEESGKNQAVEFEDNISDPEWDDDEEPRNQAPGVNFNARTISKPVPVLIEDILNPPGRFRRPPRLVIILRGPPGSGKTYLAKLIKDREVENGGSAPRILSLDDYFMVEQEKEVTEEGKTVKIKDMVYEYEAEMEESYRLSLVKSFKKTITDGYFPFIIVDNVNEKVKYFGEMWSFAKQNGFQVYICQTDLDVASCTKRNIHGRSEADIAKCVEDWEPTPAHHPIVDATSLLQSASIPEVEMEEVNSPESDSCEKEGPEDQLTRSKWDNFDCSVHNLAKLDGLSKPMRSSKTMEDYLRLDDEWTPIKFTKPGQKRVRWADLEERKAQEKMRAVGFVVGQTNWHRMLDPTEGSSALTQTKYIEKTGWQKVPPK